MKEEAIIKEVEKVFDSMRLEPEILEKAIAAIRSSSDAEKDYYMNKVKELQTEHIKIKSRMDKLTDLFLDGDFAEKEYKEKRQSLEQRREEIIKEIESNNRADNNFAETLIIMLKLASNASAAFKGSTVEEKHKLLNLVFSNLELKGQKIVYTLRSPFDAFVKTIETGEWCRQVDDFRQTHEIRKGITTLQPHLIKDIF